MMNSIMAYYQAAPLFFIAALLGTILFALCAMLLLMGFHHFSDISASHSTLDVHHDLGSDGAFNLFSLQSIVAFIMGFGWVGLTAKISWGLWTSISLLVASAAGLVFMFFSAWLMAKVYSLNQVTKRNLYSAIGEKAQVYLTIPNKGEGAGQVQVVVDGQQSIIAAISQNHAIKAFTSVEVVGIEDNSILVVESLEV